MSAREDYLLLATAATLSPGSALDSLAREAERALDEIDALRAVLREAASDYTAGDRADPRLGYVEVQIDRETWNRVLEYRAAEKPEVL